jgi:transposase
VPARFRKSKAVGAVFGLTCSKYQSGEIDQPAEYHTLRRRDDADHALRSSSEHAAAFNKVVLAQGMGDANRQAARDEKAIVALARRLAVIMHRIWIDGTEFRWTREQAAVTAA